jgi:RHS repeat-associated protein
MDLSLRLPDASLREGQIRYAYDEIYQLTNEERKIGGTTQYTNHYVYDANGNRIQKNLTGTVTNNVYNMGNQLIEERNSQNQLLASYEFDANGNMITKTEGQNVTTWGYDWQNHLNAFTHPTDQTKNGTYFNCPMCLGKRMKKTVNSVETRYVYDGDDIVADLNGTDNSVKTLYLTPALDENLFMLVKTGETWTRYWYFHDGLGSVRQVLGDDGTIYAAYDYQAFGEPYEWALAGDAPENRYTYTGREWDAESGDYAYRAREQHPLLGCFAQRDQIESPNLYAYVRNCPLVIRDPIGLQTQIVEGYNKWASKQGQLKKEYLERVTEFLKMERYKDCCFPQVVSLGDPETAAWAMAQVSQISVEPTLAAAGEYRWFSDSIALRHPIAETMERSLWHELMHAIFDFKKWFGSISDIKDEERYTTFTENASIALDWLNALESVARKNPKKQPCTDDNKKKIQDYWNFFIRDMTYARTHTQSEEGQAAGAPPLTEQNLKNLKEWTGVDVDPNKVLDLYLCKTKPKDEEKSCCCCGEDALSEIIKDRPPVQWEK